jgi:hypothetical protein
LIELLVLWNSSYSDNYFGAEVVLQKVMCGKALCRDEKCIYLTKVFGNFCDEFIGVYFTKFDGKMPVDCFRRTN